MVCADITLRKQPSSISTAGKQDLELASLPWDTKCGKIRRAGPYSSVDRALPSGGKNRRSSRRRGAEVGYSHKPLNTLSGVFSFIITRCHALPGSS